MHLNLVKYSSNFKDYKHDLIFSLSSVVKLLANFVPFHKVKIVKHILGNAAIWQQKMAADLF